MQQYPRELHHLVRLFRRWRLREAFGVRGACSRFRVSNHQQKRQQAGRTLQTLREVRLRLCRLCRAALYRRFPIRRLGNVPNAGKSGSPAGWELCDTADWKSIGNLRYIDHFDKAEMRALSSASSQFA